ncbi:hypothetical protein [Bacillus sp. 1P06AnD]|uniref:hypothetical protein n=1 Tax=Bacillus sp. 1P06AnD TaxID=3132208 RepID=UPI0039A0DCFD
MNYKKIFIVIITGIIVIFALYFCIHSYANGKVIKRYAEGFKKNPLGDYCKNTSNTVLCVYDAPLFKTYTNLSVSNSTDKIDLIIWVPLYGENLKFGLVITDDEAKESYEIEVDKNLETNEKEYQDILKKNQDAIDALKSVVREEWGTDL